MTEHAARPTPISRARMHLGNGEPWRARDVLTGALAHARGEDADEILDLLGDVYASLGSEPHEIDQQLETLRNRRAAARPQKPDTSRGVMVVVGLLVVLFVTTTSVVGIITILRWMLG